MAPCLGLRIFQCAPSPVDGVCAVDCVGRFARAVTAMRPS